jgi:hypothetical protein
MNLAKLSSKELFASLVVIEDLLRERKILRSSNNPTGDLAESLFCKARQWTPERGSRAGFDALDEQTRKRYQIKGRRSTGKSKKHMLGAIRNLENNPFDVLAVVIFKKNYEVQYAALIDPVVLRNVDRQDHTNSYRFILDEESNEAGITVVTEELRVAADALLLTPNNFPDIQTC